VKNAPQWELGQDKLDVREEEKTDKPTTRQYLQKNPKKQPTPTKTVRGHHKKGRVQQ